MFGTLEEDGTHRKTQFTGVVASHFMERTPVMIGLMAFANIRFCAGRSSS